MMELDELKQKWAERDRKLDVGIRIARQLLTAQRIAVGIAAPGRFLNRGVRHRACRHYLARLAAIERNRDVERDPYIHAENRQRSSNLWKDRHRWMMISCARSPQASRSLAA